MRSFESDISFQPMQAEDIAALTAQGVPAKSVATILPGFVCAGHVTRAGHFEPDQSGDRFVAFHENYDTVFWHPATNRIGTLMRRVFALNEDLIDSAATYAFDSNLNVFASVLDWMKGGCDGIVVVDWSKAFDRLRGVPRIAIDERLLPTYRKAMQPPRMPRVFVIPSAGRKAA